ncbi:substrate-binding domain-containing protein [Christensenellaceae bacterium OttesenSCG-928-K19]|nr:substrate-binding domain-containing protein [Christensenellaceae bacterium OttesenSCG-928-K19]
MKKTMTIVALVLVCVFMLAACSSGAGTATEEPAADAATETAAADDTVAEQPAADDTATEEPAADDSAASGDKMLIGFNNFLKGNYSVDILERAVVQTIEALGGEAMVVNDEAKPENSASNVDNMIAAGVDGIVFLGLADTLFPVVAQKCDAAGVPFVITDHKPTEDVLETLIASETYVGGACTEDFNTGRGIADYALEDGLSKAVVITSENTDTTHYARATSFEEQFTAGGGEVLNISWGSIAQLSDVLTRATDVLTAHPDADCVYATNGDIGSICLEALAKFPDMDAKLFVTDLDPSVLEGLKSGDVAAGNGAHWINGNISTALLINYLQGNHIVDGDGNSPMIIVPVMVLPSNLVDLYDEFWIQNQPYSNEELQAMVSADMTYADFEQIMTDYTVENRLQAKVDQGLLSQEDLDAALAG